MGKTIVWLTSHYYHLVIIFQPRSILLHHQRSSLPSLMSTALNSWCVNHPHHGIFLIISQLGLKPISIIAYSSSSIGSLHIKEVIPNLSLAFPISGSNSATVDVTLII